MKSHFNLDSAQADYLDDVDQQWVDTAALETTAFLELRRSIILQKAQPPVVVEFADRGKLLDLEKSQNSAYAQGHGVSQHRQLIFSITYQEI